MYVLYTKYSYIYIAYIIYAYTVNLKVNIFIYYYLDYLPPHAFYCIVYISIVISRCDLINIESSHLRMHIVHTCDKSYHILLVIKEHTGIAYTLPCSAML